MRPKAIKDLSQLVEKDFLNTVSEGINNILQNAKSLFQDAEILYKSKRQRGNSVLQALANEELAKILILLDAVRCPRRLTKEFTRQLGCFNDHLAKGIYSEACYWKMSSFGELMDAVENERNLYYLDGPNDVDWIFRNRILSEREETIYVDYVDSDDGHFWHAPRDSIFNRPVSCPLDLCKSMIKMGMTSSKSLRLMSDFWEPIHMTFSFPWSDLSDLNLKMLKDLETEGLLQGVDEKSIRIYLDSWQFPMYSLDFRLSKEDNREKLKEIQNNWYLY